MTAETRSGDQAADAADRAAEVVAADGTWVRTVRMWHIAFYAMVAISALAIGTAVSTPGERVLSLAAMAALVLGYTFIGLPAARTRSPKRSTVYLVLLVGATAVAVRAHPLGSILLFIAFSQIWFFTSRRRDGIIATVALTVAVWVAFVLRLGTERDEMLSLAGQMGLSLCFSLLLGLWISQVVDQSHERAILISRLEAAQAELGRSHHAAGVTAERERMAREIHDTLAQGFTSVIMLAQTASADLARGASDQAARRMDMVEQVARDNLAEARALVAAFAPVDLHGSSLGEALERLAARFEQETGVQVEVVRADAATAPALGREQEVVLLRAAQEALSNVRRHADARHVQLVLGAAAGGGTVQLEVVDDGRGISPDVTAGFGLRGMRERVTAGGGQLAVSGGEHGGTRVRMTLPVTPVTASTVDETAPA